MALRLAIQHPERVRRLALVSTQFADAEMIRPEHREARAVRWSCARG